MRGGMDMLIQFISNGTNQIVASYLIGIFFVIYFATRYFNQPLKELEQDFPGEVKQVPEPALPCYMTECARYRLFLSFFVFCTLLFYLFISLAMPQLVEIWYPDINKPTVVFCVVLGTLAFINLSKKIPWLKDTMDDFREDLQKRAKIPERAFQVFQCLQRSELNTDSDEFKKRWREILDEQEGGRKDLEENYFNFNKRTLERRWARLTYLIYTLEIWSKTEQFRRNINKPELHWLEIRENYREDFRPRFEELRDKSKKLEQVRKQNRNTDEIQEIHQFISQESEKLSEIVDDTLTKVYWLVTLLLFMSNRSIEDPRVHLKNIGWIVDTDNYFEVSKNSVVILGITIFISILVGAVLGSLLAMAVSKFGIMIDVDVKSSDIMRWLFFGIPMYILPTLVTLTAKRHLSVHEIWPVMHPNQAPPSFSKRPLFIYILVAGISYLVTVVFLVLIYMFMSIIVDTMQGRIIDIFGFSFLAFVTALYISYLIDSPVKDKPQNMRIYYNKLPGAIIFGLVNVGIIAFFFSLYYNKGEFDFWKMPDFQQGRLFVYSVIGLLIGCSIYMSTQTKNILYERRTDKRRSEGEWITLRLGSVSRRVNILATTAGVYRIAITREIKMLVNNRDQIGIEFNNGKTVDGIIEEIRDDYLVISTEIDISYADRLMTNSQV